MTKRIAHSGKVVRLKDGRTLVSPPSGGKFTRAQIERAVRAVAERRGKAG